MSTSTPEPVKPVVPTPPAPPAPPQPPAPPAPPHKDATTTDGASPVATADGEPTVEEVPVEPKTILDLRHERLTGKVIKFEQNVSGVVKTDMFEEELVFKHDRIMAEFQTHNFADNEAVEFDVHTDDHGKAIAVALKPMLNRKPNECLGQRHRGYVRRFAERWGFLNSAAFDGDLFVHRDNLLPVPDQITGEPPLRTGQVVEFDVALDDRGRAVAKQITTRALLRPSDWIGHRLRGYIRSFQGAWGFINADRFAGDLFVHRDSLLAQYQGAPLNVGTMVEFDIERDHHRKGTKNRLVARHVAVLGGGEASVPPPPAPYSHSHPYPSPYHQGGLPPYQHQPSPYDHVAYAAPQPSPYQPQAYGAPPPSMYYGPPDPSWAAYGSYAPPQYPYPQPAPYPQPSPYAHPAYTQPPYPQAAPSPYAPQPFPHPYPQPAAPVQPCPQPLPSPYGAVPPGSNTPAPQPQPAPYLPQDLTAAPAQPQLAVGAAPGGAVPVSADGQPQGLLHITMHDWEPDQPGQLFVTKGTLVNVSYRAAHGWVYAGTVQPGGQSSEPVTEGWIPQAVVKRVSLCRVILDWPPEGSGTLGVSKGEVIAVSKEAERGWVYGERIGPRQPDRPSDGWLPKKILDYLQS